MPKTIKSLTDDFQSEPELIPLNLIFDYPVRWSEYKVLRDLVQNFYDAVPRGEWENRFVHGIESGKLFLTAVDVGFSYDWLIHIGASTKRESDGEYAGYFGEGFKIASLCAVRDHGWRIELRSRDWVLEVVATEIRVDDRDLKSLAYHVWRRDAPSADTVMCIGPFNDPALFDSVLFSFYYPTNPLFGEKIWASREAAVFFRSKQPKPPGYPRTFDDAGPGIVFAGYQALGSFQYPLIFCLHNFRYNDRERSSFFRMDVVKVIQRVAAQLPAEAAAAVLRVIKNRWYDRPKKQYDFETWHPIIARLVKNVAASPPHKAAWRDEYPELLVAPQVKKSDIPRYNRRRQALDWVRSSGRRYRLVQEAFLALGYPTLEEACDQADGFSITRDPCDGLETRRIGLLEQLVSCLLPDLLDAIERPPCKVISSRRSAWQGMTSCLPIRRNAPKFCGIAVKYRLPYIALRESLLQSDDFGEALSTYLHELAHIFGGDRSAAFSRALSELMSVTLNNSRLIAACEEQWAVFRPD